MGDVEMLAQCLVHALRGERIPRPERLLPYLDARDPRGTRNKQKMAAGAALHVPVPRIRKAGAAMADRMIAEEERQGPCPWELLCPCPHEGMYLLAESAITAAGLEARAGSRRRKLAERQAVLLGQKLRLADLVAAPHDGDPRGLPGMRSNNGPWRLSMFHLRTELRSRQAAYRHLVHRGIGGREHSLASIKERSALAGDDGATFYGPAWWWRDLLERHELARKMLDGPLAPDAPLPRRLRLPLTVHRWDAGTLAHLGDPGPERRNEFVTRGSEEARKDLGDRDEDPTTWVRVVWGAPGKPTMDFGLCWESAPPSPPPGARRVEVGATVA